LRLSSSPDGKRASVHTIKGDGVFHHLFHGGRTRWTYKKKEPKKGQRGKGKKAAYGNVGEYDDYDAARKGAMIDYALTPWDKIMGVHLWVNRPAKFLREWREFQTRPDVAALVTKYKEDAAAAPGKAASRKANFFAPHSQRGGAAATPAVSAPSAPAAPSSSAAAASARAVGKTPHTATLSTPPVAKRPRMVQQQHATPSMLDAEAGTSVRDWQAAPGGADGGGDTPMEECGCGDDDPIEGCSGDDDDDEEEGSSNDDPIEEC
jgi:hypothetical protein